MVEMARVRVRIDQSGRMVIPASFRKVLGIKVGGEVLLSIQQGELRITTQQHCVQRAQERARRYVKPGTSIVDELLAERRASARIR